MFSSNECSIVGDAPSRLFAASMNTRDDVTLLRQFLTPNPTPITSQNLRIESTLNDVQLLSRNDELLARLDPSAQPPILLVKSDTQYWTLLHQISSEQGFMLADPAARSLQKLPDESGFIRYKAQQIPTGYQMHCTPANALWKVWSAQARPYHRFDLRLELLLFTRSAWFPIQEISGDRDAIVIKTLITTTSLQAGDYVTWLQETKTAGKSKQSKRSSSPSALTVIKALIGSLWTNS